MLIQTHELPDISRIIRTMQQSAKSGTWSGRDMTKYFVRCRWTFGALGTQAVFTRDTGYHTSGWWKNPDYERCRHLSLSFFEPNGEPRPRDRVLTTLFLDGLFGANKRLLWCEPPYTEHGKRYDVWHYRLFCNPSWEPILPRGEVYGRELTEGGWKSFSDVENDFRLAQETTR